MNSLITGGAGFLGSHLTDLLVSRGHRVTVIDNFVTGSERNLAQHRGSDQVQLIEQDACKPFTYLNGKFDYVFHFASPASPDDFERIPLEVLRVGSAGTEQALEFARLHNAAFLLASTSEVYGDPAISPQPESYWGNVNSIGPRSCYDEAKRYAEALTMSYRRVYGLNTHIVRFFNTYGPRMRLDDGRVVPNFVCQALAGKPITIYGDGAQTRSFGYFDDIIEGVYRTMMSDFHEPINLGTENEKTIYEFAEAVIKATRSSSKIVHVAAAVDDPKQRRPDLTRAKNILDWEPTTTFDEGLAQTISFFKNSLQPA